MKEVATHAKAFSCVFSICTCLFSFSVGGVEKTLTGCEVEGEE